MYKTINIKMFTDSDLDGVGCAILAQAVFGKSKISIEYCNPRNINEKINNFIKNKDYLLYDKIFITDLSINSTNAYKINTLCNNFQLLDHHPTALWLNKYKWATVITKINNELTSGTKLFYEYANNSYDLKQKCGKLKYFKMLQFAEMVRKYDTWLWHTKYQDIAPKQWNDLLYAIGIDKFVLYVHKMLNNNQQYEHFNILEPEQKLLELRQLEINQYIFKKNKELKKYNLLGLTMGVVFADQYHSELGNRLNELNPQLDLIAIVDMSGKISFRTIHDDVDVSAIAKYFNGGGHPKASGCSIKHFLLDQCLSKIFEGEAIAYEN